MDPVKCTEDVKHKINCLLHDTDAHRGSDLIIMASSYRQCVNEIKATITPDKRRRTDDVNRKINSLLHNTDADKDVRRAQRHVLQKVRKCT